MLLPVPQNRLRHWNTPRFVVDHHRWCVDYVEAFQCEPMSVSTENCERGMLQRIKSKFEMLLYDLPRKFTLIDKFRKGLLVFWWLLTRFSECWRRGWLRLVFAEIVESICSLLELYTLFISFYIMFKSKR